MCLMEMGCKVPAPVFWSQMTVYLLLSLLKNICGQVWQLQLGFDAESPRSDFTHERSSQGIDRVEFWGQNDSARHPSKLARNSLEPRSNSLARCTQNSKVVNELLRVICVYTFLVWVLPRNHHCICNERISDRNNQKNLFSRKASSPKYKWLVLVPNHTYSHWMTDKDCLSSNSMFFTYQLKPYFVFLN